MTDRPVRSVSICVCPDGLVHGFPDLTGGMVGRAFAFCGTPHEHVRDPTDNDHMCDECTVQMGVFLGLDPKDAERVLSEAKEDTRKEQS